MYLPPRGLKIFLSFISILCLSTGALLWQCRNEFFIQTLTASQKLVTIPKGTSAKKLSSIFYQSGLIQHPYRLLLLLKFHQLSQRLKSGTYLLTPQDTAWSFIEKIKRGQTYYVKLVIVEGTRYCSLINQLKSSAAFVFKESMLQELRSQSGSLEGLFFPSTYMHAYGESVLPVLKLAQTTMQQKLMEVWNTREANLPYQSPYELLIAASIIEKESALAVERRLISGVIVNRLRLAMPLQMDPSVAYGIDTCQSVILKGQDTKKESPFNTYLHQGLPPTPIAMVSFSALEAAAHPFKTAFLYFVAKADGHHIFSVNYQQHQQAIRSLHAQ